MKLTRSWAAAKLPEGKNPIKTKWVFKIKHEADGTIRYKARMVVRGFTQMKGIDYQETYSPVVRYSSIRYLITLAVKFDLHIHQMDAMSGFLQGDLDEEIYVDKPKGFDNLDGDVFRLKNAVYGLKQASLVWNQKLDCGMKKLALLKSKIDSCIFYKINKEDIIILAIYVDDILISTNIVLFDNIR